MIISVYLLVNMQNFNKVTKKACKGYKYNLYYNCPEGIGRKTKSPVLKHTKRGFGNLFLLSSERKRQLNKQHLLHDSRTATTTAATKRSYIKRSWHLLADSKRGIAQRSHQNAIKQSLTLRLATRAHSNNRRPFQNVRALKKPSYRMVAIQADGMPE